MTTRVELGGTEYVLGLDWDRVQPELPEADELRQLIETHDSQYGVKLKGSGEGGQSLHVGFSSKGADDAKQISGAAYLALNHSNIVLVEMLDEQRFWMVVVTDGVVYPGTDIVGSLEACMENVAQVFEETGIDAEHAHDFRLCAPGLTHTEFFEGFENEDFATLVADSSVKTSRAQVSRIMLPIPPRIAVAIGAIVLLLLYMVFGGEDPTPPPQPKSVEQLRAEGLLPPAPSETESAEPDPEDVKANRLVESSKFISAQLQGGEPSILLPRARSLVKEFWPSVGGFVFRHITVSHGGGAELVLEEGGGTLEQAYAKIDPSRFSMRFSNDGSSISLINEEELGEEHPPEQVRADLEASAGHAVKLASTFQRWGLGWSMSRESVTGGLLGGGDEESKGRDVLNRLIEKLGLGEEEEAPFVIHSFELQSDFYMLPQLEALLSQYPTLTVTSVQFGDEPKAATGSSPENPEGSGGSSPKEKDSRAGDLTIKGVLYEIR